MNRVAGLIALGVLAAFTLTVLDWGAPQAADPRATQASPLRSHATQEATPLLPGPFDLPGAVPVSLVIENAGEDDQLIGGSSPVAARVAPHQTQLVDGHRVMSLVPDGIAIPGGETIILEPAGAHLMLIGLREDLVQGETLPLTLHFERAGKATVTVRVRRKVDAAGVEPIAPVVAGDLRIALAAAPPAPVATPAA